MVNNSRVTIKNADFSCRIADKCSAEEWIEKISNTSFYSWDECPCYNCPFKKYINLLAKYEDQAEKYEDDLK